MAEYEVARWVRTVGNMRATQAQAVRARRPKDTLPELLAQAWLDEHGIDYQPQVEMGVARLDVVVFDRSAGATCVGWAIQGERWHEGKYSHDDSKHKQMLNQVVRGARLVDVVPIWEDDIYQTTAVFEDAMRGYRWRD